MGAGMGLAEAKTSNEPLRQKIEALEAQPEHSLRDTLDLAQARARHTVGTWAEEHPKAMVGAGALTGALFGARKGPGIVSEARKWPAQAQAVSENVKDIVGRKRAV
jgi:hypothetical protein